MQLNSKTGLTCLTCNLVFASGEIQRVHYVGEWHSYNIKRQIAGLPPVSAQDYQQKAQLLSQNIKENSQFEQIFCSNCRKNFQSAKAYENHLNSKKHKEIVEKGKSDQPLNGGESTMMANDEIERDSKNEVKDATMDERKAIPVDGCLFCPSSFKDLDSSLLHMSRAHGFLVPDFQYCTDLPGLISYLGMKVGEGRTCIRCNNNRFRDLASLHKHMRDKNHCNFRIDEGEETLLEFMDFYDYNDVNTGESDGEESENDNILYEDGCFLTLPSGARIGHRSLMRYFKQSLKPVKETDGTSSSNRALVGSRMKALGWTGLSGPLSVKHAKDMAFMKRTVQNYRLKQGMTNNKTFVSRGRNDQQ